MSYQALYRVWRPQQFSDVVGQAPIVKTLQNAMENGTYSHAYLLTGPRGTGKTSTAKIMAKAVNCERAPAREPCNQCDSCTGISRGAVVDVVEIDAASNNGVDEIRDLRENVKYAPTEVRFKVYIIDEVHMLSQGAFNALLKTLEEPPRHVLFILATTEPHKIPATIISRCQRFDFKRVSEQEIVSRLETICAEEQFEVEPEALQLVARVAEGGLRDALSLLDQAVSFAGERVTLADVQQMTGALTDEALVGLAEGIMNGEMDEVLHRYHTLIDEGKEPVRIIEDLIYYYRDLLVYLETNGASSRLLRLQQSFIDDEEQLGKFQSEHLLQAIQQLSGLQQELKWVEQPRLLLEVGLIRLMNQLKQPSPLDQAADSSATVSTELEALSAKVARLEQDIERLSKRLSTGEAHVAPVDQRRPGLRDTKQVRARSSMSESDYVQLLETAEKPLLSQLQAKWPAILDEVKEQQIVVHAWLRDGEPVACGPRFFLLAFKSAIHRETIEEKHRELVEQVAARHVEREVNLTTIMYNEWETLKAKLSAKLAKKKGKEREENDREDPFYHEAVKLVGPELIEVVESSEGED